jgi:hypothetical protein
MYNLPNDEAVIDGGNPSIRPTKPTLRSAVCHQHIVRAKATAVGIATAGAKRSESLNHGHGRRTQSSYLLVR